MYVSECTLIYLIEVKSCVSEESGEKMCRKVWHHWNFGEITQSI